MKGSNKQLAPVAIFVYNRLKNTKAVIEALQDNYLAKDTDVFVFSDGPKSPKNERAVFEVRQYLKSVTGFKSIHIIERPENFYIEKNIIEGVTETINRYGRIIVLEDDGVTAKNFLTFMNDALDFYESREKIMHIATFTFIKIPNNQNNKTFLWSYSENTGGGWGTWANRWEKFKWFKTEDEGLSALTHEQRLKIEMDGQFKCLNSLKLKPIPWDICWNIAIIRNDGLAVNSPKSLIKNNGLFNGTHFTLLNRILGKSPFEVELGKEETILFEDTLIENTEALNILKEFYAKLGKRKRDRTLNFFVRILVKLKITKIIKRLL